MPQCGKFSLRLRCISSNMFRKLAKFNRKHDVDQLNAVVAQLSLEPLASRSATAPSRTTSKIEMLSSKLQCLILNHLTSRDALSLTSACKSLRLLSSAAYAELCFLVAGPGDEDSLAKTVARLRQLLDVLRSHPEYASQTHSLFIHDKPNNTNRQPTRAWGFLMDSWDEHLSRLVSLTQGVRYFAWFACDPQIVGIADRTVVQLLRLPHLCKVSLCRLHISSAAQLPTFRQKTRAHIEDVCLELDEMLPQWCNLFLMDNEALRSLYIRELAQADRNAWVYGFLASCHSWCNLQTLTISCYGHTLTSMITLLQHCGSHGYCLSLSSISVHVQYDDKVLPQLLSALSYFNLRRLRFVVNVGGRFFSKFTPETVAQLLESSPSLEELVIDCHECTSYCPLPWNLIDFCNALRAAPKLRILTLPTMFLLDGSEFDQESYADEFDGEEEEAMDVDEDEDSAVEGAPLADSSTQPSECDMDDDDIYARPSPHYAEVPSWLEPTYHSLAIWIEVFLDELLRKQGLQELRCIHDLSPAGVLHRECRMIRFEQIYHEIDADSALDAETAYMIRYLGVMGDSADEDDAFWWLPREHRRGLTRA
ncbi:hypothetical protein NM688_g5757 [Phlebia brevispora]|uniref:Uncharacterized protein n=1 Tax=Phlebia brevispora TaxID=194682 RepID=A0ACC1SQD5_9APHY|nr:hypothetical protein NM688_g5757 [Phlebia brevispora]